MLVRAFAVLALLTTAATAQPAAMSDADKATFKKHCTNDYLSYCGNLAPDSPEVSACFKANMSKLAPGCQAAIAAYSKKPRASRASN